MRLEGDIVLINQIEQSIKKYRMCQCTKNGGILNIRYPYDTLFFVKTYSLIIRGYWFEVDLRFDKRAGTGRFDMSDGRQDIFWQQFPDVREMVRELRPVINGRRYDN